MKKKKILLVQLFIVMCVIFAVTAYSTMGSDENVVAKQVIALSTGPFTVNTGELVRVLLRNPVTTETLQYDLTVHDLITGNPVEIVKLDVSPSSGISRTVEVPDILDSHPIFVTIFITGIPQFDSLLADVELDRIQKMVAVERMTDISGGYQLIPLQFGGQDPMPQFGGQDPMPD